MFIHSSSQPSEADHQNAIELGWAALSTVDEPSLNMPKIGSSLGVVNPSAPFPVFTGSQGPPEIEEETIDVEPIPITRPPQNITNTWFMGGGEVTTSRSNHKCRAPTAPIESHPPRRTFRRRHILRNCALSSVIVGQLTSFPKMLIQGHHLPPFMTPPCHVHEELAFDCAKSGRHQCLIKELAICAGLVEMYFSRTPQNADYVWKMIYAERDQLRREHEGFDIHHQLAALQAVTIYILLQAQDVENSDENETNSLLMTVLEIALSASQRSELDTETLHKAPNREQWVHEESGRRTIMVLLIINLMMDCLLDPTRNTYESSCRNNIETILLPATRDLWEAPTNFIWRTEYERYMSRRKTKKALKVGDLLRLSEVGDLNDMSVSHDHSDVIPDVLAWCESLDSLGSLLWMVVPFHQWRMNVGMSGIW
ncbi:hypothetical protein PISL3812_06315 [Talaromyces islandicus]|uniref:Transcription factor domain-containing protein n=1 Tax=Talaromyces islandicus TaxID=28573 RepID=A0A0U1M162_TALIS|nr:hypothetical protein PISL3812_06315 [Talaromyces islandicus]